MKKIIFIALAFLVFAGFAKVNSQVKVGFVDSDLIIKQLPEAVAVQKKMEEIQKSYLDTITGAENEIKAKADVFKTEYEDAQKQLESGKLSGDQAKIEEAKLTDMQNEL